MSKNIYVVDVDAKVSDIFIVKAKNATEAKKLAVLKFAKMGNFRFITKKCKNMDEAREAKHWGL